MLKYLFYIRQHCQKPLDKLIQNKLRFIEVFNIMGAFLVILFRLIVSIYNKLRNYVAENVYGLDQFTSLNICVNFSGLNY